MLEKIEGEPIARLYINGEPIPQYIEEVLLKTEERDDWSLSKHA